MARTAPRTYPGHGGFHWAITEGYLREDKARVKAYKVR